MIFIASDHVGVELKAAIIAKLKQEGHKIEDLGPATNDRVNYTDFANKLCAKLLGSDSQDRGILICGTGIGMSMMANRHHGIRAAVCTNEYMAEMTRRHNDSNVLCLGSRVMGDDLALAIVSRYLASEFEGGRHMERVQALD